MFRKTAPFVTDFPNTISNLSFFKRQLLALQRRTGFKFFIDTDRFFFDHARQFAVVYFRCFRGETQMFDSCFVGHFKPSQDFTKAKFVGFSQFAGGFFPGSFESAMLDLFFMPTRQQKPRRAA